MFIGLFTMVVCGICAAVGYHKKQFGYAMFCSMWVGYGLAIFVKSFP